MALGCATIEGYLEGARFKVRAKYDALRCTLTLGDSSCKLWRWILCLSDLEFDVVHEASVKHQASDAPLRRSIDGQDNSDFNDALRYSRWGQRIEQKWRKKLMKIAK